MPLAMCCSPKAAASDSVEAICVEEKVREGICEVERETAGATARRADDDPLCIVTLLVGSMLVQYGGRRRSQAQGCAVTLDRGTLEGMGRRD